MNSPVTPPLDRPLPASMAANAAGLISFYQRYPVFSWSWSWRRTILFGSVALLAAVSFGASHAVIVKDWLEGVDVGWRFALTGLSLVGLGPALAAAVRHRGFARRLEANFIVSAVLIGMLCTYAVHSWGYAYHLRKMVAHYSHMEPAPAPPPPPPPMEHDVHWWVLQILDAGYVLLLWFVASGGLALESYFAERRRWAQYQRHEALEKLSVQRSTDDLRLAVLQAQVEPHFLFNTLASVRSLIHSDPPRAAVIVDALAEYLRATLPKFRADTGVALSTLGEQFDICESYLELMRARMGDRLRVEVRLPQDLRALPFPPLMLISLVENAIKHGVEPKAGESHVILEATVRDEPKGAKLQVQVIDDGAGLQTGVGVGTGLSNIRAQLLARFDSGASLDLSARESGGVTARIMLPMEQLRA